VTDEKRALKVAALVADGFQEEELTGPQTALVAAGIAVELVAPRAGEVQALHYREPTRRLRVTVTFAEAHAADYDALLIPGGLHSPDTLGQTPAAMDFLIRANTLGKPIATICRGGRLLAAADIVRGRHATGFHSVGDEWFYLSVKEELIRAGALWEDQPAVIDGNLVSSRHPNDLAAFNAAMKKVLGL
jgi:deglycase